MTVTFKPILAALVCHSSVHTGVCIMDHIIKIARPPPPVLGARHSPPLSIIKSTVEPPNKGHVGDSINSSVLPFIERLSSFRGSKCTKTIRHIIFGT